jgi:hypothetical protein
MQMTSSSNGITNYDDAPKLLDMSLTLLNLFARASAWQVSSGFYGAPLFGLASTH